MSKRSTSRLSSDDQITSVVHRLRAETFYLGDQNVTNRLAWFKTQYANIVVDQSHSTKYADNEEHPRPGHAILSAVVTLTAEDFWLSSDGYWEESVADAPSIADVVLSCTGAAPSQDYVRQQFTNVIANLNTLVGRMRTDTRCMRHVRVLSAVSLSPKIKFQHILFEVGVDLKVPPS